MDAHAPDWFVVNEFDGGKAYVDRASVTRESTLIRAPVKYVTDTPGIDKRNGRPVKEMLILEECDIASSCFRIHEIIFTYEDGTKSDALLGVLEWRPATGGNGRTL
jgi:hypothetical protein